MYKKRTFIKRGLYCYAIIPRNNKINLLYLILLPPGAMAVAAIASSGSLPIHKFFAQLPKRSATSLLRFALIEFIKLLNSPLCVMLHSFFKL